VLRGLDGSNPVRLLSPSGAIEDDWRLPICGLAHYCSFRALPKTDWLPSET
jgi:hypothetical protein